MQTPCWTLFPLYTTGPPPQSERRFLITAFARYKIRMPVTSEMSRVSPTQPTPLDKGCCFPLLHPGLYIQRGFRAPFIKATINISYIFFLLHTFSPTPCFSFDFCFVLRSGPHCLATQKHWEMIYISRFLSTFQRLLSPALSLPPHHSRRSTAYDSSLP